MSVKREDLVANGEFSLGDCDNIFKVIAEYKDYHWIEWIESGEVESVYFERHDLKKINRNTLIA
jgi:hypothetical protein